MEQSDTTDYDIYISYSHLDLGQSSATDQHGWISRFLEDLEAALQTASNRQLRIWYAVQSSIANKDFEEQNNGVLQRSKILIPVVDPNYLTSVFALRELTNFVNLFAETEPQIGGRIFPVYLSHVPIDDLPIEIRNLHGLVFYDEDFEDQGWLEFGPNGKFRDRYFKQIDELAAAILKVIQEFPEEPIQPGPSVVESKKAEVSPPHIVSVKAGINNALTPDCERLLTAAVGMLPQKSGEKDDLTTSTVFFAAVELGLADDVASNAPTDLVRLARAITLAGIGRYEEARAEYFLNSPPEVSFEQISSMDLPFETSENLKKAFEASAGSAKAPITASDLLLSILRHAASPDYKGKWFPNLIMSLGLTIPDLEASLLDKEGLTQPHIWLCQYRRSEMKTLEQRMAQGGVEPWRIHPLRPDALEKQMNEGDIVVLWRTVDEVKLQNSERSRGGIVGWGKINKSETDLTNERISVIITHAFPDEPIPRDGVLELLGKEGTQWPGQISLKRLNEEEAAVILRFHPPEEPVLELTVQESHETELASDRAETTRDLLGRAPLAFTLAHHINRIWTEQTKPGEKHTGRHAPDEAAFILHIDSPWGGGKTTFANFIARILNPKGHGIDPENRKKSDYDLLANLKLSDEEYWPSLYANREWITVTFNAWQNQHVSPPWWNFYESIIEQCLDRKNFIERWRLRLIEWCWRVWSSDVRRILMVGLVTACILWALWMFGDLNGMIHTKGDNTIESSDGFTVFFYSILALAGGSGIALVKSVRSGVRKIIDSAGRSTDIKVLGEADPLGRFRLHFSKMIWRYSRPVMVIVDDLDRCEPDYVVELVRGMLTIFRSPRVVFVLLGDKSWIETSFAKVHAEMKAAHTDDNISFGERFSEKVIQLSFILPDPDKSSRDAYIDYLLLGEDAIKLDSRRKKLSNKSNPDQITTPVSPAEANELSSEVEAFEAEIQDGFRTAKTGIERQAALEKARDDVHKKFGSSNETQRLAEQVINREAALRAASSERTDTEIRHGISSLKNQLPGNPRRIKRIINMIAVYQASAQAVFGFSQGSDEWRQLVLWIILMSEHPDSWRILSNHPELADKVINGKPNRKNPNPPTDSHQDPEIGMLAILNQRAVVALIKCQAFESDTVHLNAEALQWLRRLTPLA